MERSSLYQMIWRWHFYAGLFVIPMVLILATTGGIYLFKPQVERWEERSYQSLAQEGAVTPAVQREAALASFPGAGFKYYRLPQQPGDAAMIHLALAEGGGMRDVFVSPQGKVLGAIDPDARIMEVVHEIHGKLLLGRPGSWLVELAASWAIVMIATGLYLWWPKTGGLAGVLWPRLGRRGRPLWRDLHAVTGFWVSAFALILLVTGLPWAGVWGEGLGMVRAELGWVKGEKGWTTGAEPAPGGEHAMHMMHDHAQMAAMETPEAPAAMLDTLVDKAAAEKLAFPVVVSPPGGAVRPGLPPDPNWTVRSDAQNRPERVTIHYDAMTGTEVKRDGFEEKHAIDKVVAYGIAWHEGQLFGGLNQLIGLLTALALLILSISGFVMWRKRKPGGTLGAPPLPDYRPRRKGIVVIAAFFFVLLPLFAISIVIMWFFDKLVLPRLPGLARWLGISAQQRRAKPAA